VSIALGLLFALPVALTGILFGRTVVGIFGAAADVEDEAAAYTSLVFLGIPFLYTNFLATAGMRGSGDTRTPLYIGGLVNAVNVFLNVNLIYGYMGFPALGVRGAAIGTTLSYLVGALAFLRLLLRPGRVPTLRGKALGAPLDPAMARRILRLGSPVAAEQLILQVGFTLWVILVTGFGSTALAAHMVGMRVNLLAFMPGFGYSLAATALVGQNLGAEKPFLAERSALESAKLALVTMGLMAVGFFVAAEGLARLFIPDPAVITKAALWIRIYALGLPAFGIFFSLDGALRGAGDVVWPTAISAASFFAIRLTLSWQLGHIVFGDVVWVWVPMVIDFYARTLMVFWRFSAGVWKTVTV
jgi:putative MATE family efflux protein